MEYKDKFMQFGNYKIHYLDNEYDSKDLIIIFPPGIQDARFVLEIGLDINVRIVSISYPSRYKSSILEENNSIENIATQIKLFITKLLKDSNFKSVKLVGFSFGTAVITNLMGVYTEKLITKLVLINPGEFFKPAIKSLLLVLFKPALKSSSYAVFLKFLITKVVPFFDAKYFPNDRLKKINEQWLSTINYNIDKNSIINIPCVLFIGKMDNVIDRDSLVALNKVFINNTVRNYNGKHILDYYSSLDFGHIKHLIIKEII